MAPVEASRAEPDFGTLSRPGPAMMAELAAVNLQRLFWLLIVGLGTRLVSLVANHFSAASSDVLAAMQWFDLVAIPPLIVLTWRLRRPAASVRLAWMLILFVMWGTLGMAVIQALISATDLGYRAIYVFGVMIVGIAYVLPPRLILPAFALTHFAYLGLVTTGDYDARFKLASVSEGSLGVVFAAGVSWLLYRAKWTELVRERTIERQNRALADRNAEMGDLMAIAAHDLRSPLQGLDQVLEIAGGLVDPAAGRLRQALEEGRASCRRMLSLVTRLLDAHAAEHRQGAPGAAGCDAAVVFDAAMRRHQAAADARGVTLRSVLPSGPAPVAIGAEAMGQVLDNLLGNALKFAPANSTVDLVLKADETGGWVGEVRDEGSGVPVEEQAELFGKFRRGTNRPENGEGGFGLGLFIVRQLLLSAGGEVVYLNGHPRGAVFRMVLPPVR